MAKSLVFRPWEFNYGEECVSDCGSIRNALTENMTTILKRLDLSTSFWTMLLQHSVVDTNTMRKIQAKKTQTVQAQSLLLHIMEVKVYKFHGFIWALVNSHQCHLAELLGFAVRDYLDEEAYLKSSNLLCPACHEFYTKAYILTGCGHYVCAPCVKGAQFMCKQNQKEDITCPVPECGKITEASPAAGNIGLEEDVDFSDLCQAVLKEVTNESGGTTEGKSTRSYEVEEMSSNGSEEEEVMSTSGSEEEEGLRVTFIESDEEVELMRVTFIQSDEEEENNLSEQVKDGIRNLDKMIPCLKKYRVILEKHEPEIKSYITDTVQKAMQNIDEWEIETLGWYSSLRQQVEKNVHKSVKWQKAASELSILIKARPAFQGGHLKGKVNLPKETVTVAGEKLINKLDAGWPIPPLLTRFPYISSAPTSNPPAKAKFLLGYTLEDSSICRKLAWMPDGSLMVLTDIGVWRLNLKIDTAECTPRFIRKTNKATDISVADDGTWMLSLFKDHTVEVHYPGVERPKRWKPHGVNPWRIFINNKNIYIGQHKSQTIRSYSREFVYLDQYHMEYNAASGNIHVTERGTVMGGCTGDESKIYMMDTQTNETSSFGSKHTGDGRLVKARGVCTVNEDEYILVCDNYNSLVSVFTHDGQFIHHIDVDEYSVHPYTIAVLSQRGKPLLMALDGEINKRDVVGVYSLE